MSNIILSPKQEQIAIFPYQDKYKMLLAGGATQSGKTWACWIFFVAHKMLTYNNEIFVVIGQTKTSAEQNVIDKHWNDLINLCGYELHYDMRKGIFTVTAQINGKTVKNRFRVFGGGNTGDEKKIVGATYADAFFDEIVHISEDVFNEIYNARLSKNKLKARPMLTFNPASHGHWVKRKLVDKAEEKNIKVLTFLQEDNPSIDEETRAYNIMMAKDSGVFYKRMYEAMWADSTGLVYSGFTYDKHVITEVDETKITAWWISCDYGEANPAAFLKIGYMPAHKNDKGEEVQEKYIVVNSYYWDGRVNGTRIYDDHYEELDELAGDSHIEMVICDKSALGFIETIRRRGKFRVKGGDNSKLDGIRATATVISRGLLKIKETNEDLIREFGLYSWDDKAIGEDRPIDANNHALDALRYFVSTLKLMKISDIW